MYWSPEEVVTALYFASRKITLEAVSALLARRGYNRSSAAINKKLGEVRQIETELYNGTRQGWNLAAVDRYLDSLLHCTTVNTLIKTTEDDHRIIIEHHKDKLHRILEVLEESQRDRLQLAKTFSDAG